MKGSLILRMLLPLAGVVLTACHHQVKFEELSYPVSATKQDAALVVVITPKTLNQTVPIVSFMTGAAHTWEAQPGLMLKDVADIELSQMFRQYRMAPSYEEPEEETDGLTLELSVPHYTFADFRATVTIRGVLYRPGRRVILDKIYTEQGFSQGSKMFWGGAFAMKSAIRQSSLDAYKKVFSALRADVEQAQK